MSEYGDEWSSDTADRILVAARAALAAHGHGHCDMLDRTTYIPEMGQAVCGCGVFADMVDPAAAQGGDDASESRELAEAADPFVGSTTPIDPTAIYTPEMVERHILDITARIEGGIGFERAALIAKIQAVEAWELHYQRTLLMSGQSSADKRKAEASVSCDDAGLTQDRLEKVCTYEAVRQAMHNLRSVLSGLQSVAKSVIAMYGVGGTAGSGYNNNQRERY